MVTKHDPPPFFFFSFLAKQEGERSDDCKQPVCASSLRFHHRGTETRGAVNKHLGVSVGEFLSAVVTPRPVIYEKVRLTPLGDRFPVFWLAPASTLG